MLSDAGPYFVLFSILAAICGYMYYRGVTSTSVSHSGARAARMELAASTPRPPRGRGRRPPLLRLYFTLFPASAVPLTSPCSRI